MPVTDPSPIARFLAFLQFEKRYSPHTIASYQIDLLQFFDFLQYQFDGLPQEQVSSSVVRSWLASLKEDGISAKSINRKLSSLKSFFKYQLKTGTLTATPIVQITAPRIGRKLPVYVEEEDISRLLKQVYFPEDYRGRLEKLIIEIFYHTGMRISELLSLRESYFDPANNTLKVLGKGNKERILPLSRPMTENITRYLCEKRTLAVDCDAVHLLVNTKGKKLSAAYVRSVVKTYLSEVTTIQKKSPHVLRHSFATHLMNHGADLNSVKELLGHASLAATQIYTHNTIEKLKDIHKKAHPKA